MTQEITREDRIAEAYEAEAELEAAQISLNRIECRVRNLSFSLEKPNLVKELPAYLSEQLDIMGSISEDAEVTPALYQLLRALPHDVLETADIKAEWLRANVAEVRFSGKYPSWITWLVYYEPLRSWPLCKVTTYLHRSATGVHSRHFAIVEHLMQYTVSTLQSDT